MKKCTHSFSEKRVSCARFSETRANFVKNDGKYPPTGGGRRRAGVGSACVHNPEMSVLLAGELRRRRVENARAGYLRSDQKGRNHGRHADKSQELINGKHVRRPPRIKPTSAKRAHQIGKCQKRDATVCSWLVRSDRRPPLRRSSAAPRWL